MWHTLGFRKQADLVLDNITGLTDEELDKVRDEWAKREYPDVLNGDVEALADLQNMAMNRVMEKYGIADETGIDEQVERLLKGISK